MEFDCPVGIGSPLNVAVPDMSPVAIPLPVQPAGSTIMVNTNNNRISVRGIAIFLGRGELTRYVLGAVRIHVDERNPRPDRDMPERESVR